MTIETIFLQTKNVGGKFRPAEARELFARVPSSYVLLLKREPTNRFDENAIQVLVLRDCDWNPVDYVHQGEDLEDALDRLADEGIFAEHVGYIPKDINPPLAELMNQGAVGIARLEIADIITVQIGEIEEVDSDYWPSDDDDEPSAA